MDTIADNEKKLVTERPTSKMFRFGDGQTYKSIKTATIPIHTGTQKALLDIEVVKCNIPLLLSNNSLKKANANLDFGSEQINFMGEEIPIKISKSGHYYIKLSREPTTQTTDIKRIFFTSPINPEDLEDSRNKIKKLHKQFAHPHPKRLKKLISDSGVTDKNVMDIVQEVTDKCEICRKFKKPLPRPVVAFPTATSFCEVVAMDLKDILGVTVLHMIDHATRYSSACTVPNKKKETIVRAILQNWIRLFGSPDYFLSDNGGEFINDEMIEMAEQFNIFPKTTAAESAWSNGMVERHNEILADLVRKVQHENNCSFQIALHWALAAKNSLINVYGFSPNQLVFGRNIELPSAHKDKIPAQNKPSSEYIMENLKALHTARQAFIQQESSEKLRRALNRQTRSYSNQIFHQGQEVFYYRNNSKKWHGPAKILGRDSQQYLLKHGGVYIRVHPCRIQLCHPLPSENPENENTSKDKQQPKKSRNKPTTNGNTETQQNNDKDHTERILPLSDSEEEEYQSCEEGDDLQEGEEEQNEQEESIRNEPSEDSEEQEEDNQQEIQRKPRLALRRLQDYNKPGTTENIQIVTEIDNSNQEIPNRPETILFGKETESDRFDIAKEEEIQKWRDLEAFTEIEDQGQPTISCRWVCTEKIKGNNLVTKARLVIRGFEEDTTQLQKDSPTCSKETIRLLITLIAGKEWTMHSLDIKSAFLQGNQIQRNIIVKPPKCANTKMLWRLNKTPYGLSDAGRQWFNRVYKELTQLGATQSKYDKATFIWYKEQETIGIMIVHVDDFLYGGTKSFQQTIIQKLHKIFRVGLEETKSFRYLGLSIEEESQGIVLSTKGYGESCKEIPTATLGADRDRKLSAKEITSLKQISGQLNWVTTHSRPDMSFENCMIGNSISKATVRDIYSANRALRRLRENEVSLFFPRLMLRKCVLVGFCDSSYANLPDGGSQGAYIIFLADSMGSYCPIAWQSRRIRRVVHSTIAAECLSAVEVAETCAFLNKSMQELIGKDPQDIPVHIFSDNKSLVDNLHTTTSVEDRRLRIDICVLRDMCQNGEITQLRWIPTELQVANALTKKGCSSLYLYQILQRRNTFDISSGVFHPKE